jgi:ribonuclease-3
MADLDKFQATLGVKFQSIDLLKRALTHRSACGKNNERLEFLGDAVLGMVIAHELFIHHLKADEGLLSRYRSLLVRKETLAEIAREYDFGAVLILGQGELSAGSHQHDSILADAFEAVLGALFLEHGIDYVQEFLVRVYNHRLNNLPAAENLKDPKTRLQEWLQARKHDVPEYTIVREKTSHPQRFEVKAEIGYKSISAKAGSSSRRKAEQKAAGKILGLLDE